MTRNRSVQTLSGRHLSLPSRSECITSLTAVLLLATAGFAETHTIYPNHHSRVFSAFKEPVLRLKSGDTVITRTWDSGG